MTEPWNFPNYQSDKKGSISLAQTISGEVISVHEGVVNKAALRQTRRCWHASVSQAICDRNSGRGLRNSPVGQLQQALSVREHSIVDIQTPSKSRPITSSSNVHGLGMSESKPSYRNLDALHRSDARHSGKSAGLTPAATALALWGRRALIQQNALLLFLLHEEKLLADTATALATRLRRFQTRTSRTRTQAEN